MGSAGHRHAPLRQALQELALLYGTNDFSGANGDDKRKAACYLRHDEGRIVIFLQAALFQ